MEMGLADADQALLIVQVVVALGGAAGIGGFFTSIMTERRKNRESESVTDTSKADMAIKLLEESRVREVKRLEELIQDKDDQIRRLRDDNASLLEERESLAAAAREIREHVDVEHLDDESTDALSRIERADVADSLKRRLRRNPFARGTQNHDE